MNSFFKIGGHLSLKFQILKMTNILGPLTIATGCHFSIILGATGLFWSCLCWQLFVLGIDIKNKKVLESMQVSIHFISRAWKSVKNK